MLLPSREHTGMQVFYVINRRFPVLGSHVNLNTP